MSTTTLACPICQRDDLGCTRSKNDQVFCQSGRNGQPPGWEWVRSTGPDVQVYRQIPDPEPPMTPQIRMAAGVEVQAVTWLWQNRIEQGAVNLIAGDPGAGKSLVTTALAAAVSTGAAWPDQPGTFGREPKRVILVTSEDDPAKATVPRLKAAGADLDNVALLRTVVEDDDERPLCLQRDLLAIDAAIRQVGNVALLTVDPIDSYTGAANTNANEEIRHVLEPLIGLAERHGVAVLCVKHLNKALATPNALYRISGTVAYVALPRTVHLLSRDPEDRARHLFLPIKISHGIKPDGLAYAVRQDDDRQPVVVWEADTVDADADDVVARRPGREPSAIDRATAWLKQKLSAGPVASKDLSGEAEAMGISAPTLARAKERIGATASQQRDDRGNLAGWVVSLSAGGTA